MIALGLFAGSPMFGAADRHPIELLGFRFDPIQDGEPAVPADLRARDDGAYALLQLAAPPGRDDLDALRAAGVVFHDALNGNAYLIRIQANDEGAIAAKRAEIRGLAQVRWLGSLHGAYKIAPRTRGGTILLDLFPDAEVASVVSAVVASGGPVLETNDSESVKVLVVDAKANLLPALAAIDGVRWVQDKPVYRIVNDDARFVVQANERGRLPLYEHGLSGLGQVGAVSDSGLDAYDFVNATGDPAGTDPNDAGCYFIDDGHAGAGGPQIPPGPSHRKVVAYTVPPGATGDWTDDEGHGTHVVGSVVGDQAPWGEVSPADGQAYRARIYFQDLNVGGGITVSPPSDYYNNLFGRAYDPNGNNIYDSAVEPRTHSNSWGSADSTYDAQTGQVDQFMWDHPDFLIFYAAGNNGPVPLTVGNPGTAKDIVCVGASENGDQNTNEMAQFSSHGPIPASGPTGGANRMAPTIAAPGDGLMSALSKNPCGTQELSGTSMATPTTQGVTLLMREYLWNGYYPHGEPTTNDGLRTPPPSAALLKALLINSGERMTGLYTDNGAGGAWPSNGQGWGRIKASDVLYFQGDHRDLWVKDEYAVNGTVGFGANGETRTFTIQVGDGSPFTGEPLEVTLVWTDYPGSMLDGGRLVNNLNLVVTDPLGAAHRGNDSAQNDFANAGDLPPAPDAVNPFEVVYLNAPPPGTYTITITAAALGSLGPNPTRRQGYGLVVTGDLRGRRGRAEIEKDSYNPIPTAVVRLRVTDVDRNTNPNSSETLMARVTSTTNPTGVLVTLRETSSNSSTFTGDITVVIPDQHAPNPNQLAVQKGDIVRLSYADANDGAGRAYEAFDTAKIEDPAVALLNPPVLADPGDTDADGAYMLSWTPAEESNNRGLTRTLAYYIVEEATNYQLHLYDDAEGSLASHWTTQTVGMFSLPWTKDSTFNHTPNPPPPGESFWSQGVESGANALDVDTSLVLNQDITIPSSLASARLTFYSRYFNEPDDQGTVEVSTNGGASWMVLLRLADAPMTPPADTRMQYHDVDLTAFRGQPLRIRFRFVSTSNFFLFLTTGWWVDDVNISGATWRRIAVVPPDQTQLAVTGRFDGQYFYRVQGIFTDGSATAFGNVEEIVVLGPGVASGRVPESFPDVPLTLAKTGGDVTLQWGASCRQTDTDYEVYEGTIGSWYSHAPRLCTTGAALNATITPGAGDRYYLVVPRNAANEGSYGADSSGTERPTLAGACVTRAFAGCP